MKGNFWVCPREVSSACRGAMVSITTRSARCRVYKATTRVARDRSIAPRLFKVGSRKGENVPAMIYENGWVTVGVFCQVALNL